MYPSLWWSQRPLFKFNFRVSVMSLSLAACVCHAALYAVGVNSRRLQGVAECACMAQAGSLPDIAEQTDWLSEMELWNKFPNTKVANRRCVQYAEGHLYVLFCNSSVTRESNGRLYLATSPVYVGKLFYAFVNCAINDINGRLSVGNNFCISSGAAAELCWLGLNAFMTFCYRGVPEQTPPVSGQAKAC